VLASEPYERGFEVGRGGEPSSGHLPFPDRADPHPYEHTTRLAVTLRRSDCSPRRCDGCNPHQLILWLMFWNTNALLLCLTLEREETLTFVWSMSE
jgi:hypothetical protein